MREIKFRQRQYGKYHYWGHLTDGVFVGPVSPVILSVEWTGREDKNGVEIYEGSIVMVEVRGGFWKGVVKFQEGCFDVVFDATFSCLSRIETKNIEVIGDIHEK